MDSHSNFIGTLLTNRAESTGKTKEGFKSDTKKMTASELADIA